MVLPPLRPLLLQALGCETHSYQQSAGDSREKKEILN
jgi:hypothetical protein